MDKKTKGAWLIQHGAKLNNVNAASYETTETASKAGILLSSISREKEIKVSIERVHALAAAQGISKIEATGLLGILQKRRLIDLPKSNTEVAVLGVTTEKTLEHAVDIYTSLGPTSYEDSSLEMSEWASDKPFHIDLMKERLSDEFKLNALDVDRVIDDAEMIGFVDVEHISKTEKLLFNGNLFKKDEVKKANRILETLTAGEQASIRDVRAMLGNLGCVALTTVRSVLGEKLYQKVSSIGLFDINIISNSAGETGFVTLPSAFSKYSSSMIDDAFDLAKAFVASITYGITKSSDYRGRIMSPTILLETLIAGRVVGPVHAISQDYKLLEAKGVVSVTNGTNPRNGKSGWLLTLLKKEVGELALGVIENGEVSSQSVPAISGILDTYKGPESNRVVERKKQVAANPKATNDIIMRLRIGG
jgi:hypothetical protein